MTLRKQSKGEKRDDLIQLIIANSMAQSRESSGSSGCGSCHSNSGGSSGLSSGFAFNIDLQALVSPTKRRSKSKPNTKRKQFKSQTPKLTITRAYNSTVNNDNLSNESHPFRFSRSKSPVDKKPKRKRKRQRSASVATSNNNLPQKYIPKTVHMNANSSNNITRKSTDTITIDNFRRKKRKKNNMEIRIPIVWSDNDDNYKPMVYSKTPEPEIPNSLIKSKSMRSPKKKKKRKKKKKVKKKDANRVSISWSSGEEENGNSPLLDEEERELVEILMAPKTKDSQLKHYSSDSLLTPGEYMIPEESEIPDKHILLNHKTTSDFADFLSTVSELSTCNDLFDTNNGECEHYDDEEPEPDEKYLKPLNTFIATTSIDRYESGEEEQNMKGVYAKSMKLSFDKNVIDIHVNRMHVKRKLKYSDFYNISIFDSIDASDYYHHGITKSTSVGKILHSFIESPKLDQSSTSDTSVEDEQINDAHKESKLVQFLELVRKLDDDDEEEKISYISDDESVEGYTKNTKKRKRKKAKKFNNKTSSIFYNYNKISRNRSSSYSSDNQVSNVNRKYRMKMLASNDNDSENDVKSIEFENEYKCKNSKSVKFKLSENKYSVLPIVKSVTANKTKMSSKKLKNKRNVSDRRSQSEFSNVRKNRNAKKNKSIGNKNKSLHRVMRSNSVNAEIPKSKKTIITPVGGGSRGSSGRVTFDTNCKYDVNVNFFNINVRTNHRYRLIDGRIGVCKFKGKTSFGKGGELWIGLVMDFGQGCNDGSVRNRRYFRCREGKGEMVRLFQIVQHLGRAEVKLTRVMINSGNNFTADGKEMLEEYNMNLSKKQKLPISGFSWM